LLLDKEVTMRKGPIDPELLGLQFDDTSYIIGRGVENGKIGCQPSTLA
jgi:hypothetical protein